MTKPKGRKSNWKLSLAAVAALASLTWAALPAHPLASSQSPDETGDLKKRVAALEAEQATILKELQAIRALLQSQVRPQPGPVPGPAAAPVAPQSLDAPPAFDIAIAGAASVGRPDAKLVVVEFSDFQCPFCGRYIRESYRALHKEYVETGKIRYVFRNYPLERLHPLALRAAEAADCAHAQGKFWEMHDHLFANQQALSEPDLVKAGQSLGLDMAAYQQCLAAQATLPARIRKDQDEGARASISGTPTFFVGTLTKDGKVHVLRRLVGAKPYAYFKTNLDQLLATASH
jgi:protein-disulfide isomerase